LAYDLAARGSLTTCDPLTQLRHQQFFVLFMQIDILLNIFDITRQISRGNFRRNWLEMFVADLAFAIPLFIDFCSLNV